MRRLGWLVLGLSFVAGFAGAVMVAGLDRQVRARFEGTQFRVPSRVYSAPAILYPGLDWEQFGLREALQRLGYREAPQAEGLPPGQFAWASGRIRVHLSSFQHPARPEPARDIEILLRGSRIADIRELPSGR
jgi:hypothetical protein